MAQKINPSRFYTEWKGHPIADVSTFHSITLKERAEKPIIYLAGDSSLDNKYWVPSSGQFGEPLPVAVPPIYQSTLTEPRPKPDVAFWLNHLLGERATTLNLAVEASMLRERDRDLLDHDKFIRDNMRPEDILVVSIGGNDIAMKPTFSTILHMLMLTWLTPRSFLRRGLAWSLRHFRRIFKTKVEAYISRLVEKNKPRAVIVCMIYFPLEAQAAKQPGWADLPLRLLGYNLFPGQLQTAIKKMYELATRKTSIPGVKVIPCALFEALDGKNGDDYIARVEPSVEGGRKMALQLEELLDPLLRAES